MSLRHKLICTITLLVILSSITIGWWLLDHQVQRTFQEITHTGTLLVQHLAAGSWHSVRTGDIVRLSQSLQGPMAVEEVVYALVTNPQGLVLASHWVPTELNLSNALESLAPTPLHLRRPAARDDHDSLIMSQVIQQDIASVFLQPITPPSLWTWVWTQSFQTDTVYDFALPIRSYSRQTYFAHDPDLELDFGGAHESPKMLEDLSIPIGIAHVGVSLRRYHQNLQSLMASVAGMILISILCAVGLSMFVGGQIFRPLDLLRQRARGLAIHWSPSPPSRMAMQEEPNEVQALTSAFDDMTYTLLQHHQALSNHTHQLELLHQIATAQIPDEGPSALLELVATEIVQKALFHRCVILQYDPFDHFLTYGASAGFSPLLYRWLIQLHMKPPFPSASVLQTVLQSGESLLLSNLLEMRTWLPPKLMAVLEHDGIHSCVIVPLGNAPLRLGMIVGDQGPRCCTLDDQHCLDTLSYHLSAALRKMMTDRDIRALTKTLESRVEARTAELAKANKALESLNREKSTFVAMTSHELRTPLAAMIQYIRNMLKGIGGEVPPHHAKYLSRMQSNLYRLHRMIGQLLDLAAIESGQMVLHPSIFSLSSLVHHVIDDLAPLLDAQALNMKVEIPAESLAVRADEDKLYQIIMNLLHNAMAVSPNGSTISVTLRTERKGWCVLYIKDQGCGIPKEEQEAIFQQFFRGRMKKSSKGIGLGLWITKQFVDLHQGKMHVISIPNHGTVFTVTLPVRISVETPQVVS